MGTGTALGRVRGLGSARAGARPWWHQRLTAASNLLLVTWAVVSLLRLPLHDYHAVTLWLANPWSSVLLILGTLSVFYHLRLGLQVAIEDYQHDAARVASLVLLNAFAIGGAALAIFSILRITLSGAAA